MSGMLQEWGVPKDAILMEGASENTRQNATMSYETLAPRGIHKILLVTSAMHMPRAAAVFRKAGFRGDSSPRRFPDRLESGCSRLATERRQSESLTAGCT
jgi:uncharacterized SAM-binding protein YcdF (DUF218 family)